MNSANMKVTIAGRSLVVFLALLIVPAFGAQSKKSNSQKATPQAQPPQAQPAPRSAPQPPANVNRGSTPNVQRPGNPAPGNKGGTGQQGQTVGQGGGTKVGGGGGTKVGGGGGTKVDGGGGTKVDRGRPKLPERVETRVGNRTVSRDLRGNIRDIKSPVGAIHRDLLGQRTIVTERNGHHLVSMGPRRGYIQRPYFKRNGQVYVQRTYVVNNVTYTRVYNTYNYGGRPYYGYVPLYYYRPVYYGWAYEPWPAPVYYTWGWYGDPWYGPYGYYFAPEPYYPTASLWLTDYLIAENLRLASDARQNAQAAALTESTTQSGGAPARLDPETKRQISEEVKQQLAAEKQAASAQSASAPAQPASSSEALPALDPHHSVFIVSSNLDVSAEDGECVLTPGDVITRIDPQPGQDNAVEVMVNSSKKADCTAGSKPRVQVADLQEMHNHFREQIDSGLKMLAENQGKGGLPKAPDTSTTTGEVAPPPPDKDVEAQLQKQQIEADQAEKEVAQAAPAGQGGSN